MMKRTVILIASLISLVVSGGCKNVTPDRRGDQTPLCLAASNRTDYVIVTPAQATAVDAYAAKELGLYLRQITGAEFPIVTPEGVAGGQRAIYVGLSAPALKRLGKDPLGSLQDQEHVARCVGRDVFLYGKGIHGNLHAVMNFLEDSLGWRWYSIFEYPVIPLKPVLTLAPFSRKQGFSFAYRHVGVRRGMDYYYQLGLNQGFDPWVKRRTRENPATNLNHFVSAIPDAESGTHSLFSYIPPEPGVGRFDWVERTNYFATNPEFFSMADNGQRVKNRQLCFSNPGLRRELTKNVLKHITIAGGRGLLAIAAQDCPGAFCACPACKALETKYKSPGGPIYDYLIELCGLLKTNHPQVLIKTLAYRHAQTQKPPTLPEGVRLPDNLVIDFAPIEDNYFADWTHPDPRIQATYADLKAWGRITTHLWAWLYPNPWGTGIAMPVGNVERLIINMRLMHKAGVEGVFTDHCSYNNRGGWSELQAYLFYKLAQDVNADTDAIVREFTDSLYGPAGALMRTYLTELEAERKAMTNLPPGINYRSSTTDERTFPYLTVGNIHRWQGYFDRMDEQLAGRPERERINVHLVRRELDLATLWKWHDLRKAHPDAYKDYMVCANRITAVNNVPALPPLAWEPRSPGRQAAPLGGDVVGDFITLIKAGGQAKPLPPQFAGEDPARVRQFVPRYSNRRAGRAMILDPEAAFGYAVPAADPDFPFTFGFHGAAIERRTLELKDIVPNAYHVYKLGRITLTPTCSIWFTRGWSTNVGLGERFYEPGAENVWEAYVSMKFLGPTYGGRDAEDLLPLAERKPYKGQQAGDLVLVDRIILVPRSADQFAKP